MTTDRESPHCVVCNKAPNEIEEYVDSAEDWELSPDAYVRTQEGTYNQTLNIFYCTECYIAIGMPLGVAQPQEPQP